MKSTSSILLLALASLPKTEAKTIEVCPTCAVKSVREAVGKANAFDTVLVRGGHFREGAAIEITKPLAFVGVENPVLDGEQRYQPVSIKSNYVSVSGFTVIHSGSAGLEDLAGIKNYGGQWVYIFNNTLKDNYFGIYLQGAKHCFVSGNRVESSGTVEQTSGNGIHAWKCDSIEILNNFCRGNRDGIYFEFVTHSQILGNHSEGNIRYGLHFMFSHNDHYADNTFLKNGAGVAVMYSRHVNMERNQFLDNQGSAAYGILLKDISDSQIERNLFAGNTTGIFMEGCSRSNFLKNDFRENGWAVRLQASCEQNLFSENNFMSNTFDVATNNALVLNTLERNYWDKYEGYDLDRDGIGDVPFRPVSLFATISEQMPYAMMLWRSFMVALLDRAEKVIPSLTPENMIDRMPMMKKQIF